MLQSETSGYKKNVLSSFMDPSIYQDKLRVATVNHVYYIDVKDIVRIQSLSNYSKLFFNNGKSLVVSKVLAHFDALLTESHFVRIHRTHLVNLLCIKKYERGNMPTIGLNNDEVLPVSRSKKKVLQHEMRMLSL